MSLWFPVMVNDAEIGRVIIRRTEEFVEGRHEYRYEWDAEWSETPKFPGDVPISQGDGFRFRRRNRCQGGALLHDYRDGAMALIGKVLDRVNLMAPA